MTSKTLSALALTATLIGGLSSASILVLADHAYADGKGNGNGGGNGSGNSNGNGGGGSKPDGKSNSAGSGQGIGLKADRSAGNSAGKSSKRLKTASIDETSAPKNAHGKLASELKGLNAVHASASAFANASPNSQVGRIATYRDAALSTVGAAAELQSALADVVDAQASVDATQAEINALSNDLNLALAGIEAELAALDPNDLANAEAIADLNTERDALTGAYAVQSGALQSTLGEQKTLLADVQVALEAAQTALDVAGATEADALAAAANGRTLSPEAINYIRDTLGL